MVLFFSSIVLSIFIFKNSLYYTISLLVISFIVLSSLALNTYLSFLTSFILIIVYCGAIMILIGYICAITPNLNLEPNYSNLYYFVLIVLFFFVFNRINFVSFSISTGSIVDYFYSYQGCFIFVILVSILFITLLIVTSQYTVPYGPFRSVEI